MPKFSCYSKDEGLDTCNFQCDFCKNKYKKSKKKKYKYDLKHPLYSVTLRLSEKEYLRLGKLAKSSSKTLTAMALTIVKNKLDGE